MKTERVQDQKDKMQAELQALWKEQCDQLRKKKEQFATEVGKMPLTPLKWEKKTLNQKMTVMVTNSDGRLPARFHPI